MSIFITTFNLISKKFILEVITQTDDAIKTLLQNHTPSTTAFYNLMHVFLKQVFLRTSSHFSPVFLQFYSWFLMHVNNKEERKRLINHNFIRYRGHGSFFIPTFLKPSGNGSPSKFPSFVWEFTSLVIWLFSLSIF